MNSDFWKNKKILLTGHTGFKGSWLSIWLKKLGVELGFKNVMDIEIEKNMKKINNSFLEIARQDHSKIMKMIK